MDYEKYIEQNKTRWMLSLPEFLSEFFIDGKYKELKRECTRITHQYTFIYLTEYHYFERQFFGTNRFYWDFKNKNIAEAIAKESIFTNSNTINFLEWRYQKIIKGMS